MRQHALRVHAPTIEREVLAKVLLELLGIHAGGTHLHRVQDVDARLDQVREEGRDRAAGMVEDLHRHLGVLLNEGEQLRVVGLDELAVKLRADQATVLAREIIRFGDHHHVWAEQFERSRPVLHLHFHDEVEQRLGERLVGHHVAVEVLKTAHPEGDLEDAGGVAAQHIGDLLAVHQFVGARHHALVTPRVERVGEFVFR